jgi:hypothetical protein
MQQKGQWRWEFCNKYGRFSGYLDAVDPRDLVSQMVTQNVAFTSLLFGHEYEVPFEVLHAAPGNAAPVFELHEPGYNLRVQRLF